MENRNGNLVQRFHAKQRDLVTNIKVCTWPVSIVAGCVGSPQARYRRVKGDNARTKKAVRSKGLEMGDLSGVKKKCKRRTPLPNASRKM
jgi:hypothetical protein